MQPPRTHERPADTSVTSIQELTRLDGRVVVVTGGAGGIGQAIAGFACDAGATTVLVDRATAPADALLARRAAEGAAIEALAADLASEDEVARVVREIVARHGTIDVWCNNAGLGSSSGLVKGLLDTSVEEWDRLLTVNLRSVGLCCRHVLPVMEAAGRGAIVNVSSISGVVGTGATDAYSASKAGVIGLTRSLAVDWASKGVRVNCVCPGCVETPMYAAASAATRARDLAATPLGRIAAPAEIAAAVWFLATDAAAYVTGAVVCVDGGWTAA